MSFFGPFGGFDDDPFQSSRNIFSQMDRLMGGMMQDPFGHDPFFRGASPFAALTGPNDAMQQHRNALQMSPFASIMGGSMNNAGNNGLCHSFSSSSVMTMSTGPDGRPQVYQASSSSRGGPGGVRETRRSVSDSSRGIKKMAIGHHINNRSHLIEKEVASDGNLEERQEFVNLDEEEAEAFDSEFKSRARQAFNVYDPRSRRQLTNRAVDHSSPRHQRASHSLALPAPNQRSEERSDQRKKGGGKYKNSQQYKY